jgi:hypothetical protein
MLSMCGVITTRFRSSFCLVLELTTGLRPESTHTRDPAQTVLTLCDLPRNYGGLFVLQITAS